MSNPEDKITFHLGASAVILWCFTLLLLSMGICWYFSHDWIAGLMVGLGASFILILSWMDSLQRIRRGFFLELQLFLIRCHLLPEEHKVLRNPPLAGLEKRKRELMDLAFDQFQQKDKKLTETLHVLDKFVGTKASQFATQKGRQAVWEGELTRAIVLIPDVRGFTNMTEKLKPQETVRYLNRMFTEFEEIIAFAGGEINKFMGDSILAFFPFPVESPEVSVKKALMAALQLQDNFHRIEATFQETFSESIPTGLGIGMACGDVIIGNLGSARRMEFTLIGDTVNFASRLCAIAEDGQILVTQDMALIAGDIFRMEALEPIRIKGKTGTYRPYSVMGEKLQPGLA
jgi:class 3 adenylate cyclase